LETTLDNQTTATVNTTTGTQLSEQELHDVVVGTLHALADIGNVGENGTTVTLTETLGRRNLVGLGAAGQEIGVVALDEGEEARDEERVGDGLCCVVLPDTGAGLTVTLRNFFGLFLSGILCDTGLGELSLEVIGVDLGLGLGLGALLFLHGGGVELAVSGGGLSVLSVGGLGGLLCLLLF
jgi:hypothetical protein